MRHVVRWCQLPASALFKDETEVFRVVVAVSRHHVESHSSKHLADRVIPKPYLRQGHEELSIRMSAALLEIQIIERA